MKTSNYLLLVCLVALAAVTSLAGIMLAPARPDPSRSCLSKIRTDDRDLWDEAASDTPPLSPGAAMRIALNHVLRVRLPDDTDGWVLHSLALHRMSFCGGPEEWVYVARFQAPFRLADEPAPPPAWLEVPVRFDGTVPPGIAPHIL